jgi:DNA-binding NarL/FixJ family response regulator
VGNTLLEQARSVLLIDDQEEVLTVATSYLSQQGFQVRTASLWTEAMLQLQESPPDIVLLDLYLPTVQGEVLLEFIREQHPELPVVLLSSDITPETIDRLGTLGANGFIRKPFEGDDLLLVVEQALFEQNQVQENESELKIELEPKDTEVTETQSEAAQIQPGSGVGTLVSDRGAQPGGRKRRGARKRRGGIGSRKIRNYLLVFFLFLLIAALIWGMQNVLSGGLFGIQI